MLRSPRWLRRPLLAAVAAACALALPACDASRSPLDDVVGADGAGDPWSRPAGDRDRAEPATAALGGDLQKTLARVAESVSKPGPYEAPERSPGSASDGPRWDVMELGGPVVERTAFALTGGGGTELGELVGRLRAAAKQPQLVGVIARVEPLAISIPDAVELRAAMHELRAAGKRLVCHTEGATNTTYLVLAACEQIALAPLGEIAITGPAAVPLHVRGLLDRLGVTADFLHVGAYKGAAEPLTLEAPSTEMIETLTAILDQHHATMVQIIARDRALPPARVGELIDEGVFQASAAQRRGLVDAVATFEAFRDGIVGAAAWQSVEVSERGPGAQLAAGVRLLQFLGVAPLDVPAGDHVALVYAVGAVIDGEGGGVLGARREIASHTLVAALRKLTADARVKAVVLRIDSGGGSAQASELIWRAVADLKAKKPVVVSMSDVAGSGGYYIAAGATKIFAHPDTLTGSIGVVSGKLAPGPALAKVGVRAFPLGRGRLATMAVSLSPWTAAERAVVVDAMDTVYREFVGRVAAGRGKTPAAVEPIAQGRIWTGAKAQQLGLVDELGGLDAAVAEARRLGGVPAATELEVYPPPPTLRDVIQGMSGVAELPLASAADAAVAAIATADGALGAAARRLVELALSFRHTRVQTVTAIPAIR